MRRVFLPGLVIILLSASAIEAGACSVCTRDGLYFGFPFAGQIILTLIVWRVLYGLTQFFASQAKWDRAIGVFLLTRSLLLGILYLGAMDMGILLYLIFSYIKAVGETMDKRIGFQKKSTDIPRKLLFSAGVMHSLALVSVLFFAVRFYSKENLPDTFDRFRDLLSSGSGFAHGVAWRIATDPGFDLDRVKELIESSELDQRKKAFLILEKRQSMEDTFELEDAIFLCPDLDLALLRDDECRNYYLEMWLEKMKVPESIQTADQLREWIAKQKELREEGLGNDGSQTFKTDG